jgi:hypothetical protein
MFFFEKKNQKTFLRWLPRRPTHDAPCGDSARAKVFWFFFSKKNTSCAFPPERDLLASIPDKAGQAAWQAIVIAV